MKIDDAHAPPGLLAACALAAWALVGCASAQETTAREALHAWRLERGVTLYGGAPGEPASAPEEGFDGSLAGYQRFALAHHPSLRARFEAWRARILQISKARRLPEPTLRFGYFVQAIETRNGPQRARLGVQQRFPWPTRLTAGADAASAQARAARQRLETQALELTEAVALAYWDLWRLRQLSALRRDHLHIVRGLAETVQGRVAVGQATLADQQQLSLTLARLEDRIAGLEERSRGAEARLWAAIGGPGELATSRASLATTDRPPSPALTEAERAAAAPEAISGHPRLAAFAHRAEAAEATARAEAAAARPGLTVGVDWIVIGEGDADMAPDQGKDAFSIGLGVSLPLWSDEYDEAAEAATAQARAERARRRAATERSLAALAQVDSALRDASRRARLYTDTLIPQADAAYASVLGAYVAGEGTVAQALLAQRDLLELRVARLEASADIARARARRAQLLGGRRD